MKGKVDSLHNNQWVGEGSDKWFNEMETQVLPAIQRLAGALGHAGDVANKIAALIRRHDEETKNFFNDLDLKEEKMADKIRVNYAALDDMAKQCQQASQRLRQTVSMANNIAQQMQNGAMQGEFGDTFVQALQVFQTEGEQARRQALRGSRRHSAGDDDMRSADKTAGSKF